MHFRSLKETTRLFSHTCQRGPDWNVVLWNRVSGRAGPGSAENMDVELCWAFGFGWHASFPELPAAGKQVQFQVQYLWIIYYLARDATQFLFFTCD